jgi:retron-type reverse transcriptase
MKRHNNLFEQIITLDNLELAYKKAKLGKGKKTSVIRFAQNSEGRLLAIQESLINKTFTTSSYTVKQIYEPKERTIYVLPFAPDRIVQHAIMNILEPIWDKLFIHDSYACRVGKGIHKGSSKTMEFVRKYKYCLKCDVSKFYPSIKHNILFSIIQKKIKCNDTLDLLHNIVYSVEGVPIGNYTSQWFGNLYLNELDTYLKQDNHIKGYIRYCDDFLLFHNDKSYLSSLSLKVQDFVWTKLRLILSKCDLFQVKRGVDFLGYRHFPSHVLLRKSTVKRVKKRLLELPKLLKQGKINIESYTSSLASTNGWLKWANSFNLRNKLSIGELLCKVR